METEFTPLASLFGGALIGAAAVLFMWTQGRIAGISGIVSRLIPPSPDRSLAVQSIAFIAGLLMAAPLWSLFSQLPSTQLVTSSTPVLIVAGLLVGFGSVLGSGCTSGHGVCGISRLSSRSIVATATFMGTAFLTVFFVRHIF